MRSDTTQVTKPTLTHYALDREVELELYLSDSYDEGVNDVTEGVVQFGRFPNIPSKWVLSHHISDTVADAWLVALRSVDPEGVLRGTTVGSGDGSGCATHYAMHDDGLKTQTH